MTTPQEPAVYNPAGYPVDQVIDGNLTAVDVYGTGQYGKITCRELDAQIINAPQLGFLPLTAPAGTPVGGAGGTITAATITNAKALGFQGLQLDSRYVWDASGLVINGISNFVITMGASGSIGWLGNISYNTTGYIKTDTGAPTDGIQVYASSPAGNPTQGIIFWRCVLIGSNPGNVAHFGGGQRRCGLVDSLVYNTNSTATTVAAGSNGVNVSTFAGAGVLNVASTTGFPTTGKLVLATATGAAIVSYTATTGTTFTGCSLTGGAGTLATGGTAALAAFGVTVDTALSNNNSENNLFSFTGSGGIAGANTALGIGTGDQSQHANDCSWYDLVTAAGQQAIVGAAGSNHVFYGYYDRSAPVLGTVANHGCIFTFVGGEDQNSSANGVAHLLDGGSSITSLVNRIMTQVTATNIAAVSAGNLVLRGRIRLAAGTIALSGGNVDLSDPAGNYSGVAISGAGGTLMLANNYNPGSGPNTAGYTGAIVFQWPAVVASARASGQTTTQTLSWTPPASNTRFRVSVEVFVTTAGTSTVPSVSFNRSGGVAISQPIPVKKLDGATTAFILSATATGFYTGEVFGDTDASATPVTVTVTPTGSTFGYSAVIERLT